MERTETAGRRFATWAAAILLAVGLALAAAALPSKAYADDAAIRDTANGVLKFNWSIDGVDYSRGSCFLINDNTVLTAYHCTMFSTPELEYYGYVGRSAQDLRDRMTYSVNIDRDMKIGATLLNASEEQDFAILKLDQTLNGYKALKMRDSSEVQAADVVYSVGFPGNNDLKVINTYTSNDVSFKRGTVSKAEGIYQGRMDNFVVNGYFIQTDCAISGGDSGGPMIDENGNVVGVSVMGDETNNFYYAVASDVITPSLDKLGVEYSKSDGSGPSSSSSSSSKSSSASSSSNKLKFTALDSQISEAETAVSNSSAYTEESLKKVNDALAVAREAKTLELEDPSDEAEFSDKQAEIDEATENLKTALGGLQNKPSGLPVGAIIGIVVAVVAVIVIIVLVIVMRGRKKKKKEGEAAQSSAAAAPAVSPAPQQPSLQSGAPNSSTWQKPPTAGATEDGSETSILGEESSDTIILFQAASGGSLTRMSTNENIPINSAEFTIGRERSKVDYCLEGNSSISRVHVRIVVRDGKVFLVDNRAANGTYVNGVKCRAGQEVELKAGDIITLADEKFKYNA